MNKTATERQLDSLNTKPQQEVTSMKQLLTGLLLLVITVACSTPGADRFDEEWTSKPWWKKFYKDFEQCESGDAKACTRSSDLLIANGHYDRGGEGYQRACILGHKEACDKLQLVFPVVQRQVNAEAAKKAEEKKEADYAELKAKLKRGENPGFISDEQMDRLQAEEKQGK